MKKIFILLLSFSFLGACVTLKEINQTVNCQYDLVGFEVTDYSLSNLSADVAMAITNKSKDTNARMTRFVGKLYVNDSPISDITLGQFVVAPLQTQVEKVSINVPFANISKNIVGLVSTNSQSVNYKVAGTLYFESPFGEIPFPVTFVKREK